MNNIKAPPNKFRQLTILDHLRFKHGFDRDKNYKLTFTQWLKVFRK